MNNESHIYFKRSLQILKLTNLDLAELLTLEREDGQKTSAATISRWATGTTPLDAGVRLYLKIRLKELAESNPPRPEVAKIIGFGGCKGGVGTSSLSIAVGLTLAKMGYRVLHMTSKKTGGCNNQLLIEIISHYIDCIAIDTSEFTESMEKFSSSYDFILIDMYNRLILNANEDINDLCLINSINLLVSPLDILSSADVCAIETAYSFLDNTQCNNRLIVNYNHHLEFSGVSYDEFIRRMQPWMNYLYPQTLPKVYGQLLVTQGTGRLPIALQSTDLEYRYQDLSITILDQLGIKSYDEPIENLSFYDLVDRLS